MTYIISVGGVIMIFVLLTLLTYQKKNTCFPNKPSLIITLNTKDIQQIKLKNS